ncbi:MAG: response regulator transcription factor [Chitinophagales bacterium]
MNCIIIEDQPPAQRILKKYVGDLGYLELKGTFSDAIEAMDFLKENAIDLIFLDIHLPKLSGIDFLKILPQAPHIILTTAFSDYALESYELNVVDYLLKPFSFQRFVKAVSKVPVKGQVGQGVESKLETQVPQELFIKSGYEYLKITIADIVFIKSDADYTEIYTPEKKYLASESLRYWLDKLGNNQFIQIHKSYIVNTSKIVKVSGNQIYCGKNTILPIGRAFKEDFVRKFLK